MPVSVLIPVYNAEKYLVQAVESALAQPETGEIILIDDGSTDRSYDICQQLAQQHDVIRVYQNPKNLGNYATRNRLIRESRCEYLCFLDADDYFLPGRFSVAITLLEENPDIDGVYESFQEVFEIAHPDTQLGAIRGVPNGVTADNLYYAHMLCSGTAKGFPVLVCRKTVYETIPPLVEEFKKHSDAIAMFQISACCRIAIGKMEHPVFLRREHSTNLTKTGKNHGIRLNISRYYLNWARQNLSGRPVFYINFYLMNYAVHMRDLRFLIKLRPHRLFKRIRLIIAHLFLLKDFGHLGMTVEYWAVLLRIVWHGKIIFSQKWYRTVGVTCEHKDDAG